MAKTILTVIGLVLVLLAFVHGFNENENAISTEAVLEINETVRAVRTSDESAEDVESTLEMFSRLIEDLLIVK